MTGSSSFVLGSLASLLAGLGTGVGALPVFLLRRLSLEWETMLLALAAGIMLAASAFSLLLPGREAAEALGYGPLRASLLAGLGLLAGAFFFWGVHRLLPHEHFFKGREGREGVTVRRLWLFVLAITLHNFPEGLAVGAGFGQPDLGKSVALALGIALQNMPEGLIVAVAFVALGYGPPAAFAVALLTGLVEPLGGLVGAGAVALAQPLLPWALTFAAGAMLFVVGGEMIPETHRRGQEERATFGLVLGFGLMMVLDGLL